jgi:hypothetical protein
VRARTAFTGYQVRLDTRFLKHLEPVDAENRIALKKLGCIY